MKNKAGAMEMSVGTIVTIVLLVTMLILGVVLIKNIFFSATSVVDLTDQQLRSEVNKLFSEDSKIAIYPSTKLVEIKQDAINGVGVGIKNLLTGSSSETIFNYEVLISDPDLATKCNGIAEEEVLGWISAGKAGKDILIPSGDYSAQMIRFEIPVGAPLCTIRFRVNVYAGENPYSSDFFDIKIKAK